jgi:hypothetical protein
MRLWHKARDNLTTSSLEKKLRPVCFFGLCKISVLTCLPRLSGEDTIEAAAPYWREQPD